MLDLTGKRFGRLVVIKQIGINKWRNYLWICKCDCGKDHIVAGGKLTSGKVKSCGCYAHDLHVKQLETHGITTGCKPRTFTIWNSMKSRCYNRQNTSYKNYGGKGIKVCGEWLSFENFHIWAMSNGYSDELTLDRIDNSGDYEPSNCRWATFAEQQSNTTRSRLITYNGVTKTASNWARTLGVTRRTIYNWLGKGQQYLYEKLKREVQEREVQEGGLKMLLGL